MRMLAEQTKGDATERCTYQPGQETGIHRHSGGGGGAGGIETEGWVCVRVHV